VCAREQLLPNICPSIGKKAEAYLAGVGVRVIKDARVTSVYPHPSTSDLLPGTEDVGANAKIEFDNGTIIDTDLYIPALGTYPNTSFVTDTSLLTPSGHIATNPLTLRVDAAGSRVYAIGDMSDFAAPSVHQILAAVPVLRANMKRDLLAANIERIDWMFVKDKRETQLVPIGRSRGVGAAMGWELPSWLVWLIKGRDYWVWTTGRLWSGRQWSKAG
jgi:NADH dehydrogenase FAD-containing subunit